MFTSHDWEWDFHTTYIFMDIYGDDWGMVNMTLLYITITMSINLSLYPRWIPNWDIPLWQLGFPDLPTPNGPGFCHEGNGDFGGTKWKGVDVEAKQILTHVSIYNYLYIYIHIPICQWIHLSIYPSIHLSIYPSIHLSIYPSIHLSIYPSISKLCIWRLPTIVDCTDCYQICQLLGCPSQATCCFLNPQILFAKSRYFIRPENSLARSPRVTIFLVRLFLGKMLQWPMCSGEMTSFGWSFNTCSRIIKQH